MMPDIAKTISLFSLSQTTCGNTATKDDSAAPAPNATSSAGTAQHTKVLDVAKRLATDVQKLPRDSAIPSELICAP
jgi:hypothetical protein